MPNLIHLENRSLIFINGADQLTFLQGLVSNDVTKAKEDEAIYSLMLNPQGRFLYEFFVVKYKDGLILEVSLDSCDELVRKLSFYKLRSDVEISKIEDLEVFFIDDINCKISSEVKFQDPRKEKFGFRCYNVKDGFDNVDLEKQELSFYHSLRLENKIVDENDLTFDKSIISEYGFDNLGAIDYQKGCYVGQEVVARAHYKGQIRKKVFLMEIDGLSEIVKGSEIACDGKKQGVVLSSMFYQDKLMALALIKNVDISGNEIDLSKLNLEVNEQKVIIKR